jgi:predicted transglutaminase-like cysteine proteinase
MIGLVRSTRGRDSVRSLASIAAPFVCFVVCFGMALSLTSQHVAAASLTMINGAMTTGDRVAPPVGAMLLCAAPHPGCRPAVAASPTPPLVLTPSLLATLNDVQRTVNREIEPTRRPDLIWHYATDGIGSCVQYAMEKRRALIAAGLPAADLELATALTPRGEGHLVLVVRTFAGDFVLDNLRDGIVPWQSLPYRWIARQDGESLASWVSILS